MASRWVSAFGASLRGGHILSAVRMAGEYIGYVAKRFWEDRSFSVASSLSYTTLLAVIPVAAISFAVLSAFPVFDQIRINIQAYVLQNFLPQNVESLRQQIDIFLKNTRELTALGTVGLAITSVILLDTIDTYYNKIWRQNEVRPLTARLTMYWAILTLTPLLVGGSAAISALVLAKAGMADTGGIQGILNALLRWAPTLLLAAAITISYMIIPYRKVRLAHAISGAIVAALLFDLLRWGFALYFRNFPSYQVLYGALSAIPLFLLWMYLVWCAVLLGAHIAASLPEWYSLRNQGPGTDAPPTRKLVTALTLLRRLYLGMADGHPTPGDELAEELTGELMAVDPLLDVLAEKNLIARSEEESWVMARDPSVITVHDIAQAFDLNLRPGLGDPTRIAPWLARLDKAIAETDRDKRSNMGITLSELFNEPEQG